MTILHFQRREAKAKILEFFNNECFKVKQLELD